MTMRNDKKKHINKHTFPNDIAEVIDRRTTEGWPRLLREAKFASQD